MKVNHPDIAVCVLFFNKVRETINCLRSFLNAPVDIYVFNNGSHPAGREEIGKFCGLHSNIRIIDSAENLGVSAGRNALIQETPASWLFFADNDIRIKTLNWFEILTRHIAHSQGRIEAFVPLVFNAHEGQYIRNVMCEIKDGKVFFQPADFCYCNIFPGGASVVHRDVFARLGPYDPNILAFEDFELAIRGILQGQPLVVKILHDIELIHEHLPQSTKVDLETVHIRYDVKRVTDSYEVIVHKHGVYLDRNFEPWLQEQITQQTRVTGRRILGKVFEFFGK